jgi:hypothetical protein
MLPYTKKKKVKYLAMHVDRRLTWAKHIHTKRNQLNRISGNFI